MRFVPVAVVALMLGIAGVLATVFDPAAPISEAVYDALPAPQVALSYEYDDGTYLFEGAVTVPDACHEAEAAVVTDSSATPPAIRIDLSVPDTEGICLEIPTEASFEAQAEAGEGAAVQVYLNGVLVTPVAG